MVWANLGLLNWRDFLIAPTAFVSDNSLINTVPGNTLKGSAMMGRLRHAVTLDEDLFSVRWGWGRAALALGDARSAVRALEPLASQADNNPLLYEDVIIAFGSDGRFEDVINFYTLKPPAQPTQVISDTVALAYLERSRVVDRPGDAEILVKAAAQFRPGDLYINHYLWQAAVRAGDLQEAATYLEMLTHFPLEAVQSDEEQIIKYTAEVIPVLLKDGLWDRDKTVNVLSFLVWQHNDSTSVELLLQRLAEQYPDEPEWLFHLAEFYHRQGDLERAESLYSGVLAAEPLPAQAALPLHSELNLNNDFSDANYVAETLQVSSEDVAFGSNLLLYGDFEVVAQNYPEGWVISDSSLARDRTNAEAIFVAGLDSFLSPRNLFAARIDGLWLRNSSDRFYGFVTQYDQASGVYVVETHPQQLYLLSGFYRTGFDNSAAVYLGNPQVDLVGGLLATTEYAWQRFTYLSCHTSGSIQKMQLILHLIEPGQAWFDAVSVRPVVVANEDEVCASLAVN
jgi:tetratricopeptide (TPR) repeat protein